MVLQPEIEKALNDQITAEFASSYAYLGMAAFLEAESLPGMAQWMRTQSQEEWAHGMKIYQFVLDRDGRVALGQLDTAATEFDSPLAVFEAAAAHERKITGLINDLYAKATEVRDFASLPLLDWFVAEQVEEEATVNQIVDDLRRAGGEGHTILMLDREMAARTAVPVEPGA
jgi:ferritin